MEIDERERDEARDEAVDLREEIEGLQAELAREHEEGYAARWERDRLVAKAAIRQTIGGGIGQEPSGTRTGIVGDIESL